VAYQPAEFAGTLRAIAEGEFDVAPLITDRMEFEGAASAFEEPRRPEAHAVILVAPGAR
jgi:threonine dehydrogenase-like Zn-dependent dehydrogenase